MNMIGILTIGIASNHSFLLPIHQNFIGNDYKK